MAVICEAEIGRQWLETPFGAEARDLALVLQRLPSEERMETHEVSTLVNLPENDSAPGLEGASRRVADQEMEKSSLSALQLIRLNPGRKKLS
jgi:putative SOS response-associated peptidase YedK